MELIGWIGSILLTISSIPMAVKSFKEGHSDGISHIFLWLWLVGEVMVLVYIFPDNNYPLIMNYSLNTITALIIINYKYINYQYEKFNLCLTFGSI